MTRRLQMFDSMKATIEVELAESLFESFISGIEPSPAVIIEAEGMGLNVHAIRAKAEELYDTEDYSDY